MSIQPMSALSPRTYIVSALSYVPPMSCLRMAAVMSSGRHVGTSVDVIPLIVPLATSGTILASVQDLSRKHLPMTNGLKFDCSATGLVLV